MRIFIDCSYVNFAHQPTGIPRVVLKYIEGGYRWFASSGIEVIPVVTTKQGLIPVRPVPGATVPDYMRPYINEWFGDATPTEVENHLQSATNHLQAAIMQQAGAVSREVSRVTLQCRKRIDEVFDEVGKAYAVWPIDIQNGDVLFCPAYWHDVNPEYFLRVQNLGCKIVTLVHDILPITLPKFYQAPWRFEFERNVIAAVVNSDALLAVSKHTADSVKEIAARKGLADVDVSVAYNGFDPLASGDIGESIASESYYPIIARQREFELMRNERPFLMVGTLEPKKGHIPVIRSFEALWASGLERSLVIVGRTGWMQKSVVDAVKQSHYFQKKLFWFDDFDDLDLACAYQYCRGLIFSSYAEGFGIPMVEALSAHRPVIAYDTPISREVIGNHGLFYSTFVELAQHIYNLDGDVGFSKECEKVMDFNWPSWQAVSDKLFQKLAAL